MRYISTRGEARPVTFDQAVVKGQASDGGLFIPVSIPQTPLQDLRECTTLAGLAIRSLSSWTGHPIGPEMAEDVFSIDIPVVNLGDRASEYDGIHVVELFHGPTGSFKDFGARFLARWLTKKAPRPRRRRIVLVATSGDTGSAVAAGFAGQPDTSVVVLYPFEGVSRYQRLQLTQPRPGVNSFAVRGSFDDCQRAVKLAFGDPSLSTLQLTSANSINIGRLLPQMLFYLWGALKVDVEDALFVVPSGNLGNLCAGLLAARSAMPNARFVAATNRNRYLIDYLNDQDAEVRPVRRTISNAMDVAVPSNLERIKHLFGRFELTSVLSGVAVTDDETKETMRKVWADAGYIADPHTAVGLTAAMAAARDRGSPVLVMATAHPDKYRELVSEVTGVDDKTGTSEREDFHETIIEAGLPALRRVITDIVDTHSE